MSKQHLFVPPNRCDAFENPSLQQYYRNLEALALDMMAPEETEDLISKTQPHILLPPIVPLAWSLSHTPFLPSVPKADQMDQRLGVLADEFKDLVYPDGYNPEASKPAAKRKSGWGQSLS